MSNELMFDPSGKPGHRPTGNDIDAEVAMQRSIYGVGTDVPLFVTPVMWKRLARFGANMANFRKNATLDEPAEHP